MKNQMCEGCNAYTNAPDGEWYCSLGSCKIHSALQSAQEVRKKGEELGLRPEIFKTDEEIIADGKGTKFDAGKPRLGEMIMDFRKPLLGVIKVWEFGANKYAKSNWKKVENGEERYTNALARHFAAEMDEVVDAETKLHHAIHVAWNALARLYFIIKDGE